MLLEVLTISTEFQAGREFLQMPCQNLTMPDQAAKDHNKCMVLIHMVNYTTVKNLYTCCKLSSHYNSKGYEVYQTYKAGERVLMLVVM